MATKVEPVTAPAGQPRNTELAWNAANQRGEMATAIMQQLAAAHTSSRWVGSFRGNENNYLSGSAPLLMIIPLNRGKWPSKVNSKQFDYVVQRGAFELNSSVCYLWYPFLSP